jgi:hypothetical protein
MPKITPRDTLCTDIPRVGTEATGISRVGIARVRLEINSLILAHQKVFEH